jgi:16S rRNA (guanine527-N7)-methyltransferase
MEHSGGRAEFSDKMNVSRETMAALDIYAALLNKWSPTINLVSKSTLPEIWTRHFLDSAQILNYVSQKPGHWLDIGSGGGLPGLVVAILAAKINPEMEFTLIEGDQRKSVFLQTVVRELSLPVTVIPQRAEQCEPQHADILSARAVAPLNVLLKYAVRHMKPNGQLLLMKGASFRKELDEALEFWSFSREEYTSITDGAAVILSLGDIKRV